MKQIKILIVLLFAVLSLQAQTSAPIRPAAKLNVSVASGSDPYTLTVSVLDDLSRFSFSDFGVGDSVYLIDGSDLLIYVVTSKLTSPNRLVVDDVNNTGISAPTGQGAIIKSTTNYKLPFYISGLRDDLRSMMMNRLSQLLDSNIATAGGEIYRYVGTSGVAPAVTAAAAGTITAQNTVGEIYTWNPATNLSSGSWSIVSGGGSASQATNGLTKTGDTIRLGGALIESTTIEGTSFPLTLSNLGATNISTDGLGSAKSSITLPKFLSQPLKFTHELTSNSLNNAKLELRTSAFSRLIINDASGGFTNVLAAPNGVGRIENSQGYSIGVEQDGVYAKNVTAQTTETNQLYIDGTTGKLAQKTVKPTFNSKDIALNWTIASGSTLSTTPFTTGFLGAEIGDFVIISAVPDDNDLTDVIAKAWVSATNQISYQIENKRSTPIVFTNKVIYINIIKK